ncbi:MAG: hypothetical protein A2932_00900 [Candidatus Spechtbacteria bacterium RIFCSPLOWO2_01_FULL_46_10]|uniref:Small-conductance mechanosensitive ion channel n=1 Tax=Candidatus Spechtbacteria bacterium RIFCSPLOWO2_01_FULL_46_10 TaxID=1802163 RepID=A0A1G2HHB2_9BACT|nr:MAG: hypothetical protein A2932_00900 [Candidatus Spechtbacteria bacterium RIFCSPLOWO2_01_FULL_46_10]
MQTDIFDTITNSLNGLWLDFIDFVPQLVVAIAVFIVGWIVAWILSKVVVHVFRTAQIDRFFDQLGVMKYLHNVGLKWEFSAIVGNIVRWFFIIGAFLAATDIVGLTEVSTFLTEVLLYLPNVIVAAFIILIGALLADFLEKLIVASMRATEIGPAKLAGIIVRWSVWVFVFLAALDQLHVAPSLVTTLFQGFVALVAIGGGLAFGLGGQGVAKDMLESLQKELKGKK